MWGSGVKDNWEAQVMKAECGTGEDESVGGGLAGPLGGGALVRAIEGWWRVCFSSLPLPVLSGHTGRHSPLNCREAWDLEPELPIRCVEVL